MKIYTTTSEEIVGSTPLGVAFTEFLPFPSLTDDYDAMIVTSKNVIRALEDQGEKWQHLPMVCVGKKTAAYAQERWGTVLFVGEGYGEALGEVICEKFSHFHFFYPHGERVAFDIAGVLKACDIAYREAVVYRTVCSTRKVLLEKPCAIIFGAPSSVKCFLDVYGWEEGYHAVAIGKTTAKAFPSTICAHISPSPSFEEAVSFVKGW